jgi:hypothetical protein
LAGAVFLISDLGVGAAFEQDIERDRTMDFDRTRSGFDADVHDVFFDGIEGANKDESRKGGRKGDVGGKAVARVSDMLKEEMTGNLAQKEVPLLPTRYNERFLKP